MTCDPNLLTEIKMFASLDEDDRQALAEVVDKLKLDAGHTLFQAGDPGE